MASITYTDKDLAQIASDFDKAILKLKNKKNAILKKHINKVEKQKVYDILQKIHSIKD
ncbi:MAG: hypothetical protein WCW16_05590 [Candidatus Magasanikbacteria bacterium]